MSQRLSVAKRIQQWLADNPGWYDAGKIARVLRLSTDQVGPPLLFLLRRQMIIRRPTQTDNGCRFRYEYANNSDYQLCQPAEKQIEEELAPSWFHMPTLRVSEAALSVSRRHVLPD